MIATTQASNAVALVVPLVASHISMRLVENTKQTCELNQAFIRAAVAVLAAARKQRAAT